MNRSRHGNEVCPTAAPIREDKVLDIIRDHYAAISNAENDLIASVLATAVAPSETQTGEAGRLKRLVADLETQINQYVRLIEDSDMARKTFVRKVGELEGERSRPLAAMSQLTDQARETTDELAKVVALALDEAKACLANAPTE